MKGKEVCYHHGGKSLVSIAQPQYKHGRYSKYMPQRMLERFEAGQKDTELLALRTEIAILDARTEDLLKRVDSGESGELWRQLREAQRRLHEARRIQDGEAIAAAVTEIDGFISRGMADYAIWNEITGNFEKRRRLTESEAKRLIAAQQTLSVEEAMLFLTVLTDSVRRNVTDRDALRAISEDISRYALQNRILEPMVRGNGDGG